VQNKLRQINCGINKINIGFKGLDLAVDSARLLQQPDLVSAKRVVLDASYLYSMYSGINGYSALVSGVEVVYQMHLGEYQKAFNSGTATLNAMALPYILAVGNRPYLSFAYVLCVTMQTMYNAIDNAYGFILELMSENAVLKSAIAYKELTEWLSFSPLQGMYNFESCAREYKLLINSLLFEKEKSIIGAKMKAKGEFGQEVFDYVHLPTLVEKYELLNAVVRGVLTEEEAVDLQAKHIAITSQAQNYEHCVEVRSAGNDGRYSYGDKVASEYYCYNMVDQVLDYVLLTEGNNILVIERLWSS
jgi:hypothetical protein